MHEYFWKVISILEWLWFLCLLILTGYFMVIFRRRLSASALPFQEWPGVTILIAHQNDTRYLRQNLKAIHNQDYPSFEILIVDDHSSVTEKTLLEQLAENFTGVTLVSAKQQGKKNALMQGVQSAQHDLILCTDADCKPKSDQWIKKMVTSGRAAGVVLGYSPYKRMTGWLNLLIRFETVMTGIQYISWAMAGKPYMGVGRNLLYRRSLFLRQEPYRSLGSVPYGDDDLLVQAIASDARVKVCDDVAAHVISEPPLSWKDWFNQKHRHMSAGHYYKKSNWWQPGLFGTGLFVHWIIIPMLMAGSNWWKWVPVFLIGLLIRWKNYAVWTGKLGDRDTVLWYPLLEISYAIYLGLMGMYTMVQKKTTWTR